MWGRKTRVVRPMSSGGGGFLRWVRCRPGRGRRSSGGLRGEEVVVVFDRGLGEVVFHVGDRGGVGDVADFVQGGGDDGSGAGGDDSGGEGCGGFFVFGRQGWPASPVRGRVALARARRRRASPVLIRSRVRRNSAAFRAPSSAGGEVTSGSWPQAAAPPSDEDVSATAVPVPAGAGCPEAGALCSRAALRPGTAARPETQSAFPPISSMGKHCHRGLTFLLGAHTGVDAGFSNGFRSYGLFGVTLVVAPA